VPFTQAQLCIQFEQLAEGYQSLMTSLNKQIFENQMAIERILNPKLRFDNVIHRLHGYKSKRGLLDAGGELLKSAFGVATQKQVDTLATHVFQIESFIGNSSKNDKESTHQLEDIIKINTERVDNVYKMVQKNHDTLNVTWAAISELHRAVRIANTKQERLWYGVTRLATSSARLLKDRLLALQHLDNVLMTMMNRLFGV
jgi:hypothetical protein